MQITYPILVRDQAGNVVRQMRTEEVPDPSGEELNAATLRDRARAALAANSAYLALGTPTVAQTTQQVARLTRECSALIRLLIGALDDTADT